MTLQDQIYLKVKKKFKKWINIKSWEEKNLHFNESNESFSSSCTANKNKLLFKSWERKANDNDPTSFTKSNKPESIIASPAQFSSEFLKDRSFEENEKLNNSYLKMKDSINLEINSKLVVIFYYFPILLLISNCITKLVLITIFIDLKGE